MTLPSGTRLGPYEVLSPLGAGGMGEVYRARDTRLDREVAVKVLPSELSSDAERLKRFEKEARSASSLNHPNIVTIYDIGAEGGVSYIAMERVEGPTLRALLVGGALPDQEALPGGAADRGGSGQGARGGDRASGPEARERDGDEGRAGEDPGLRPGEADFEDIGQRRGLSPSDDDGNDAGGSGGDGGLHVAGAGERPGSGLPVGPVCAGVDSVRDGDGEEGVSEENGDRHAGGDTERGAGADRGGKPPGASAPAVDLRAVPGEGAGGSVRLDSGPGAGAGDGAGPRVGGVAGGYRTRRRGPEGDSSSCGRAGPGLCRGGRTRRVCQPPSLEGPVRNAPDPPAGDLPPRRISKAQFGPDGRTIIYSQENGRGSHELFSAQPGNPESKSLGLPSADILSVSPSGELAIRLAGSREGTLATVPLSGGAPRELLENVGSATWDPDGKTLAVTVAPGRIEYPPGKVLYQPPSGESAIGPAFPIRFSPRGDRILFAAFKGYSAGGHSARP